MMQVSTRLCSKNIRLHHLLPGWEKIRPALVELLDQERERQVDLAVLQQIAINQVDPYLWLCMHLPIDEKRSA